MDFDAPASTWMPLSLRT